MGDEIKPKNLEDRFFVNGVETKGTAKVVKVYRKDPLGWRDRLSGRRLSLRARRIVQIKGE